MSDMGYFGVFLACFCSSVYRRWNQLLGAGPHESFLHLWRRLITWTECRRRICEQRKSANKKKYKITCASALVILTTSVSQLILSSAALKENR